MTRQPTKKLSSDVASALVVTFTFLVAVPVGWLLTGSWKVGVAAAGLFLVSLFVTLMIQNQRS